MSTCIYSEEELSICRSRLIDKSIPASIFLWEVRHSLFCVDLTVPECITGLYAIGGRSFQSVLLALSSWCGLLECTVKPKTSAISSQGFFQVHLYCQLMVYLPGQPGREQQGYFMSRLLAIGLKLETCRTPGENFGPLSWTWVNLLLSKKHKAPCSLFRTCTHTKPSQALIVVL